jgi:predicted DNA-binding transcriptional regulator YafY
VQRTTYEVTFSSANLTSVVSWVLKWGPHARVIEPRELADAVFAELRAACPLYS